MEISFSRRYVRCKYLQRSGRARQEREVVAGNKIVMRETEHKKEFRVVPIIGQGKGKKRREAHLMMSGQVGEPEHNDIEQDSDPRRDQFQVFVAQTIEQHTAGKHMQNAERDDVFIS